MSCYYNEAFENPDYQCSETLEIDRGRNSQKNQFSHQNPYDSSPYGSYREHSERGQSYLLDIPMASMRHGSEYSQNSPRVAVLSGSLYGNTQDNLSFEPEPELAYSSPSTFRSRDFPYTLRLSNASEVSFIQRHDRRPDDEIFMTSSSPSETDQAYKEEKKLIGSLVSMPTRERIKAIQKMPETMKKKRDIRNKVLKEITKKSGSRRNQFDCCTQCLHRMALSYRQFRNGLSECFHLLQLWHKTLKIIRGEFGTSVLSYFIFLKWLLTFNIFSFLINFSFITIPQFVAAEPNNLSFTGLELITGAGYFQETVLYYGFYTNATISKTENGASYNMQLAYIFTVGVYFIICLLSLVFSMAQSFYRNFINPWTYSGSASKLLCTWDFNITNEKAVKLKQKNLSTQIKEALFKVNQEVLNFSLKERVVHIVIHLASWITSLGTALAACAGVYFLSINNLELFMKGHKNDLESQAAMLVLPIVASLLNAFIPFFYSWLGLLEKFQNPGHRIYVTITRNIILKISIVGILCYYWLNIVAASESQCWESLVGQDIYRLILIDFIFCLLGSFFGEFVRRIVGTTVCVSLGVPEFDIARNVLDLIYAQTLTWIGIFFSPLLPGIQMMMFFIVFYVKKVSLMMNCQPPRKVWRATQMTTVFIFLLFFPSFVGVLSVIAVTVWRLKPSKECGPFRGLSSMYAAISEWIEILKNYPGSKWVVWIYQNLFESELFFFILSTLLLIITYIYWQVIEGRKTMDKLLRKLIINEGKDKMFLLEKLRMLQTAKQNPSAPRGQDQQAEQAQLSQPFFIGEMLQSPHHLGSPLLDPLQECHVSLVLESPELDTVLQRSSASHHSSMQPAQHVPNYLERAFDRNQNASYDEFSCSPEILEGIGLPLDGRKSRTIDYKMHPNCSLLYDMEYTACFVWF
ncbi:transmembrane channel-like protein 5 isoform X2 [Struthio camelus]|uniref:transmembrane channel-like protein 5 isoform X2 n=1 Tax=Struthio camelus TaxID=8801 RepID=UPI003604051F